MTFCFIQAGAQVKDVVVHADPSKASLLLTKHADYIEAFEKDKDDYVCMYVCSYTGIGSNIEEFPALHCY